MTEYVDATKVAGTLSGRIMSFLHGTSLYKNTALIHGICFDDIAESVRGRKKGNRTEIELEIHDMVFKLQYRKGYLFHERESWNINDMNDIQRMLIHFQNIVGQNFVLVAAAGVI